MRDLLRNWDGVSRRIARARKVFFFFDFDGTLAPIAPLPGLVVCGERVRESLRKLSGNKRYVVGIISGRGLADVRRMVGIDGILYAGNHGFEVSGPGIAYVNPAAIASRKIMEEVACALGRELEKTAGAFVEDKIYSLSIHYRRCAADGFSRVKDIVDRVTAGYRAGRQIRVTSGKKVLEIRPHADWHKGRIVEWLMDNCAKGPRGDVLVWYAGDDLTDEDAFKAVNDMGGITVLAGRRRAASAAEYVIASQEDITALLAKLEAI